MIIPDEFNHNNEDLSGTDPEGGTPIERAEDINVSDTPSAAPEHHREEHEDEEKQEKAPQADPFYPQKNEIPDLGNDDDPSFNEAEIPPPAD